MATMDTLKRLTNRAIVTVSGEDASSFLNGLVTNGPPRRDRCFSALLSPQGKVLFDFYIHKAPEGYWFDIHQRAAEVFMRRLMVYRLRAKVEIEIDETLAVLIYDYGDRSVGEAGDLPAMSLQDFHAKRIAAGVPEWGEDFGSDEVFPMDVNFDLLYGVDYKKGCFIGQEVASRMKRKGEVRKRTLIAAFDGDAPESGAPITSGESTIGHILSGAKGRALALVRLDRMEKASEPFIAGDRTITLSRPLYMEDEE